MKTVRKLTALFTHPLEGCSVVHTDLEPMYEGAMAFNFPFDQGKHMEVRFSVQDEHVEKPYADPSPLRAPSLGEVMRAVECMYAMIATGHRGGLDCQMPDGEPEGFGDALAKGGFSCDRRDVAIYEWFFRAGVDFANSNKESAEGE